jgi:hypothetical protein
MNFVSQFSFDWIVFDSIDRGMDLIVLIWLKLDTLLLIEVVCIYYRHKLFHISILNTIKFRFELVIMYMLWLAKTIVIWLTVTVLFPYDFRPTRIQFGLLLI